MDDVYENIDKHNSNRKRKILIVFDDMIADIMTNKKFQAIIKELCIRCRKLNILLVFITQSYFSVPKDVRLNATHYLIMKIRNKKELKSIAINHSRDIDYKDFHEDLQIMRKRTIFFVDNRYYVTSKRSPKIQKKNCFNLIKITVAGQIKILDRKIKQKEVQYGLDKKVTKISALTSNNLDKYEYLTGEDLGYKPSAIEQARFEYSPLGKIFNKRLSEEDKKKGF